MEIRKKKQRKDKTNRKQNSKRQIETQPINSYNKYK